jgi:hypothetical protein
MKPMICSLTALVLFFANSAHGEEEYKFIREIPIGGEGGWDYLSIDAQAGKAECGPDSKDGISRAHDGARSGDASDLPGIGKIHAAARAFVGLGATAAPRDRTREHEGVGLRQVTLSGPFRLIGPE